jgi:hypothetical protein
MRMKFPKMRLYVLCLPLLAVACKQNPANPANLTATSPSAVSVSAPAELTPAQKVAAADEAVKKIEAELSTYKMEKKMYRNPDPQQYYDVAAYTFYYKGAELVKLIEAGGEEGYYGEEAYYYQNGKLFYAHDLDTYMDDPYEDIKVYIENDAPYAAFGKEKKSEDEATKLASLPVTEKPAFVVSKDQFAKTLEVLKERSSQAKAE